MSFGGKINPKSVRGGISGTNMPEWMNYVGLQYVPNIVTTSTKPAAGALYVGNNIQVTGASDRNIIMYLGTDSNSLGSTTQRPLSVPGVVGTVALVTGHNSPRTLYSGSVVIGDGATISVANSVVIGASAAAASGTQTVIGYQAGGQAGSTGQVVIGASISGGSGQSIAIGGGSGGGSASIAIGGGSAGISAVSLGSSAVYNYTSALGTGQSLGAAFQTAIGYGAECQSGVSSIGFGTQKFASSDDAACYMWQARAQTTDATQTELGNNSTTQASTTINSYWVFTNGAGAEVFDVDVVARQGTTGECSYWKLNFLFERTGVAANSRIVGFTSNLIAQTSGAAAWSITVTADTTNARPQIKVTGEAAKTIRWVANCKITQVRG